VERCCNRVDHAPIADNLEPAAWAAGVGQRSISIGPPATTDLRNRLHTE